MLKQNKEEGESPLISFKKYANDNYFTFFYPDGTSFSVSLLNNGQILKHNGYTRNITNNLFFVVNGRMFTMVKIKALIAKYIIDDK